jgi:ATP-dependent exoDNAse (exonuclease V) beta subunit
MTPPAPTPTRTFLGWDRPALQVAAERLFQHCTQERTCDLSRWLIVLPSSLARRRLQELLAVHAEAGQVVLVPPEIVTVGQLPEHLYVAKFPLASDMVQLLAWSRALRQTPPRELEDFLPVPPASGADQQWLELGRMLSAVHRELASDRLNFESVASSLGQHPEAARWRALAGVQKRYLHILDGLQLWDIQTARVVALDRGEASTDRNIVMLGAVDLNQAQRGFLQAVAERVQIWVAAPDTLASMFDPFGCVISEAWERVEVDIPADSLLVGNSPTDQCELTAACLAELGDTYHAREITLGMPDASLVPLLEGHLASRNCELRYGPGVALLQSEPVQLLRSVSSYLLSRGADDFASLIRHPAVSKMLSAHVGREERMWLREVDEYTAAVLPRTVGSWFKHDARGAEVYQQVVEFVQRWLAPLSAEPQPLDNWTEPLLGLFRAAYAEETCQLHRAADQQLIWACQALTEQIVALTDIPADLRPLLSASETIEWLLQGLAGQLVPEPARDGAVEMIGWLDVPLDDAPVLVITGMHDGVVPESVNADPFLPNQLRRQLGLLDNSRRYARDMYSLSLSLHSRKLVRIVVGRTDATGNPLVPSRLLLACPLADLPARVLRLTEEESVDVLAPVAQRWPDNPHIQLWSIPAPGTEPTLAQVSVTAFRSYLACPYRFYLQYVLRLRCYDQIEAELDGGAFGSLLHEALNRMHQSGIGASTDAEAIAEFLKSTVLDVAHDWYGPQRSAAINVQLEQAQERLEVFAAVQAERVQAGWQTLHSEVELTLPKGTRLGKQKIPLDIIGRIDRIDYHPDLKQWAVWDYKSSDAGTKPLAAHVGKAGWRDLQLPLYRHLVRSLGIDDQPQLGYILLPKDSAKCLFEVAKFTPEHFDEADALCQTVMQQIVAGEFGPPAEDRILFDDYARICQVGVQTTTAPKPVRKVRDHRRAASSQPSVPAAVAKSAAARLAGIDATTPRTSPDALPAAMIRASAGTGKTFQLSNRLLALILAGQSVDHVLATTFTRKAAGEILQRVLVRLAKAALDPAQCQELQSHLAHLQFDQAECLAALRKVTRQLHRFRVSTLDSFYAQLARTFSLELELPPGWSAIDPVRESSLRMQAIQRMLDQSEHGELTSLVKMLSKGETRRSIARSIEETVEGGYAFFRAAPAEAWADLPVPTAPDETLVKQAITFIEQHDPGHKTIATQLKNLAHSAQLGDWETVVKNGALIAGCRGQTYCKKELDFELVGHLEVLQRQCAAHILSVRRAQVEASYRLLKAYDVEYRGLLRNQRVLTFADVTYLLARWMNSGIRDGASGSPGTAGTQRGLSIDRRQMQLRLDCGIDHLLLDEFQDTSPDQWRILEPLAKPLTARPDPARSFFCVGDTKQAIYGWRGGVAEIFDTVTSSLQNIKTTELSESFRSSPQVMQFVNEVFKNLHQHDNFAGCDDVAAQWGTAFPWHVTSRQEIPGYVLVRNGPEPDKEAGKDEQTLSVLEYAADMIQELAVAAPQRSIGVLFRENNSVALMIELLRARGVSASQEGGQPVTDSAAVQLLLSLIHLGDYPGDTRSHFHVLHSPLAAHLPERVRDFAPALSAWVRTEIARSGWTRAIGRWADALAPELSWWDRHRLTQLVALANQFELQGGGSLSELEQLVEEQRVALPTEAQVKVMTIHASKGLEFDAVFLPDMTMKLSGQTPLLVARAEDACSPPTGILRYMGEEFQELLPPAWQQAFRADKDRVVREMLCVLYVAITRARAALYILTPPRTGKINGGLQHCGSLLQSIFGPRVSDAYAAEAVLYEDGTRDWHAAHRGSAAKVRSHSKSRTAADAKSGAPAAQDDHAAQAEEAEAAPTPVPIRVRTDAGSAPRRGFRIATPSKLAASSGKVSLAGVFAKSEMMGATIGTVVHACFEQVQWLDEFSFDRPHLRQVITASLPPEALRHLDVEGEIDRFEQMLQLDSVRRALSRARYASPPVAASPPGGKETLQVENERKVNIIVGDSLVGGTIDRLVNRLRDHRPVAAEILDYKTDQLDPAIPLEKWVQERVEHHAPQLHAYADVVARMYGLPRQQIACTLVLLSADRLAVVD